MVNRTLARAVGLLVLASACGRSALDLPEEGGLGGGSGGAFRTGGIVGTGGNVGTGGSVQGGRGGAPAPQGGSGGSIIRLPDGGLPGLIGDSGVLNGILDAPRDGVLGQVLCGPEVRLGTPCAEGSLGCMLPSLGGACACLNGTYLCPLDTTTGPVLCPPSAKTGGRCTSPLSACVGGGANGCICGLGTYTCF